MKTHRKSRNASSQPETRNLTLGELIAATYKACGKQGAPKILKLALESQLVRFTRQPSYS
jgi:hypothetical protein